MNPNKQFLEAVSSLSDSMCRTLSFVPRLVQGSAREVRLRVGRPICISTGEEDYFLAKNGELKQNGGTGLTLLSQSDMKECFQALCNYSIHSYIEEIKQGFITVQGGHRAGICGMAVVENGKITGLKDVGSINLRIARQVKGVAAELHELLFCDHIRSTLILGVPASGKTTLLKDMVLQLSNRFHRVAVVDTRGEIAACMNGTPQNDLGPTTDVLDGYPKGEGMLIAIRTMAPDVIVCDEIGDRLETEAIMASLHAGVSVIATAHAGSLQELSRRAHIMDLVHAGAFEQLVFLEGKQHPCKVKQIVKVRDYYDQMGWNGIDRSRVVADRVFNVGEFVKEEKGAAAEH